MLSLKLEDVHVRKDPVCDCDSLCSCLVAICRRLPVRLTERRLRRKRALVSLQMWASAEDRGGVGVRTARLTSTPCRAWRSSRGAGRYRDHAREQTTDDWRTVTARPEPDGHRGRPPSLGGGRYPLNRRWEEKGRPFLAPRRRGRVSSSFTHPRRRGPSPSPIAPGTAQAATGADHPRPSRWFPDVAIPQVGPPAPTRPLYGSGHPREVPAQPA